MYQETNVQGPENAGVCMSSYSEDLTSAALAYHRLPRPGKLEIQAIKPLANQRDLALAYSPGVAGRLHRDCAKPRRRAASLTIRANLVAVVSNGTAVLGLGQYRPAGVEARDGRQGGSVQEIRRYRRIRHRDRGRHHRARGSKPWRRWSRPSAASTSRISRVRSVSRSRRSSRSG